MKLILVRHGETEANQKRINQGQTCNGLAANGKEQARKAGERFRDEAIDVAYVSDLQRAKETAAEIVKHHPELPVHYDKRLRELHAGVLEGSPYGSIHELAEKAGVPFMEFAPPEGESVMQLKARVSDFLSEIKHKHPQDTVLIVSHGGVIKNILLILTETSDEEHMRFQISNTGVSIVEIGEQTELCLLNCTKHLEEK